ncbi:DnaJ-like subfamily C member 7 [Quillaja saponaria]|uniref:DnaJ-like subfamily C member 7 n=1 Tax=Quillaja saponaria TaxID=32244 RepID=A0AAD7PZR3_QUISA|nr:DnaJ-like subfamily C member 7 [Quillaja saponaria]
MSPAAVDLQSPFSSPQSKHSSSSIKISDCMPHAASHSAFDYTGFRFNNLSGSGQSMNSSDFGNGIGCDFAKAFVSPAWSRPGSSARSRPRLVKVRKQLGSQHVRARTASSEVGPGFNPFRAGSETLDQGKSGICSSNGICESSGGVGSGAGASNEFASSYCHKSGNEGFEFMAKMSDPSLNLNSSQQGDSGNDDILGGSIARGEVIFDDRNESSKIENLDFVFTADQSDKEPKSYRERLQSGENAATWVSGDEKPMKSASGLMYEKLNNYDGSINMKTETSNVSSEINDTCKSELGSGGNTFSAHSTIPAFKLQEEMEKLNINVSEKDGAYFTTYYNKSSCLSTSTSFVFRSSEKTGSSSGTNSDAQKSGPAATFENIGRHCSETCERNHVQNGSGCAIANDSTEVSCSKLFAHQSGTKDSNMGEIPHCQVVEDSKLNEPDVPFSVSSAGLDSHLNKDDFEVRSVDGVQDKQGNTSTSISDGLRGSFMDFKPPPWDPSCFKENLFPSLSKKESTRKSKPSKEKGSKKIRRKLKPPFLSKKQPMQYGETKESCSPGNQYSPGSDSPMDFSPYQESKADDPFQNKTSASSNESAMPDHDYMLSALHSTIPTEYKDDHLATAVEGVNINTAGHKSRSPNQERFQFHNKCSFISDCYSLGAEMPCSSSKNEQVCSSGGADAASAEVGAGSSSNTESMESDFRMQFQFSHGLGDMNEKNFMFSTSSSGQGTLSPMKLKCRRKSSRKVVGCDSFVIPPPPNVDFGSLSLQFPPPSSISSHINATDKPVQFKFKQVDINSSAVVKETCDKWRLRGNQAYKNGDLFKAEEYYTQGINSAPSSEELGCWLKPLLLCYSNRAATRMGLGRIRDALGDCKMATTLDPTFLKVQMRAANCHLVLGELENAQEYFNKCLALSSGVCLDRRVIVEAADGVQKAEKVAECMNHSAELLEQRMSDAAVSALDLITKALSISLYSEKLLQMKADALYSLQNYDEAIQICEQSLCVAEKNLASGNTLENVNGSGCDGLLHSRLWRWSLISRCYFHLGKLEASLDILEKLEQDGSVKEKCGIKNLEMLFSMVATIRELLSRKKSGNDAFKLGKYTEAVEHYTVALSSSIKSRPFAAICFCNRAAAHQALGQIADAICDCSLAIALDRTYAKAISRRASLHEMVRDYGQAACDLRIFITILENQSEGKAKQSGTPGSSNSGVKESREAHRRLLSMEEKAKKETPLDLYLILGCKPSATAPDIKKAYHKAALRHHPDKAGQLLARSEVGDEGRLWKEISQEVRKDADRLFKMIGEAYVVLSDPDKRSQYDLEEELRRALTQSNDGSTYRRSSEKYGSPSNGHRYPFDRSTNRRYGRDNWKTYGNYHPRW